MSRRTRNNRSFREDDSYDQGHSLASNSTSPSSSSAANARHSDVVNSIARTILFKDQSKEPFRKAEIARLATRSTAKIDPIIWTHAERKLKDSLGLVLRQLDEPHDGLYILTKETRSPFFESNASLNTSIHDGLLVVVLGVIFMSGGSIEEKTLLSLLEDLNVHLHTQVLLSGNNRVTAKDLLTSIWKKQMYVQIKEARNLKKTFEWGQRSEIEISKQEILGLIAHIMNSRPEQWREQYRVAYGRDPVKVITSNNTQVNIRPLPSACTSTSQSSRNLTQEITVVDDGDDDDDDEIQVVDSQPSSSSQGRAPLKPRNSVDTSRQVRHGRQRR